MNPDQIHQAILNIVDRHGLSDAPDYQKSWGTTAYTTALLEVIGRNLPGAIFHRLDICVSREQSGKRDSRRAYLFYLLHEDHVFAIDGLTSMDALQAKMLADSRWAEYPCVEFFAHQMTAPSPHQFEKPEIMAQRWWEEELCCQEAQILAADPPTLRRSLLSPRL